MNTCFKLLLILLLISSCKTSKPKTTIRSLEDLEKQYNLNQSNKEPFANLENLRLLHGDSVYITEIYIQRMDTTKSEVKPAKKFNSY